MDMSESKLVAVLRERLRRGFPLGLMVAVSFLVIAVAGVARGAQPAVGEAAPDFTLPYATADTTVFTGVALHEALKSGPILLAFYPADWSPGCTKEVCTFRDSFSQLAVLKITIWGISGDTVFSHRAWAANEKLPFRLVSDAKHEVAKAYDVFNADAGYNQRSVFVVGKDGRILYENVNYSVADQKDFDALKAALAKLNA
jgi:peroxiredoxin